MNENEKQQANNNDVKNINDDDVDSNDENTNEDEKQQANNNDVKNINDDEHQQSNYEDKKQQIKAGTPILTTVTSSTQQIKTGFNAASSAQQTKSDLIAAWSKPLAKKPSTISFSQLSRDKDEEYYAMEEEFESYNASCMKSNDALDVEVLQSAPHDYSNYLSENDIWRHWYQLSEHDKHEFKINQFKMFISKMMRTENQLWYYLISHEPEYFARWFKPEWLQFFFNNARSVIDPAHLYMFERIQNETPARKYKLWLSESENAMAFQFRLVDGVRRLEAVNNEFGIRMGDMFYGNITCVFAEADADKLLSEYKSSDKELLSCWQNDVFHAEDDHLRMYDVNKMILSKIMRNHWFILFVDLIRKSGDENTLNVPQIYMQ